MADKSKKNSKKKAVKKNSDGKGLMDGLGKFGDLATNTIGDGVKKVRERPSEKERRVKDNIAEKEFVIPEENIEFDDEGNPYIIPEIDGWKANYFHSPSEIKSLRIAMIIIFIMFASSIIYLLNVQNIFSVAGVLIMLFASVSVLFHVEGIAVNGKPMPEVPYLMALISGLTYYFENRELSRKQREKMAEQRGVDVTKYEGEDLPVVLYKEKYSLSGIPSPGTLLMQWMNDNKISESMLSDMTDGRIDLGDVEGLLNDSMSDWNNRRTLKVLAEVMEVTVEDIEYTVDNYITDGDAD